MGLVAKRVADKRLLKLIRSFLTAGGYFGYCQTPSVLRALDEWTRRRLRAIAWNGCSPLRS